MPVPSAAADEAVRQRRLVDDLAASIDKLTLFVNTFESQLKSKLAIANARAYQLERQVGFLDRRMQAVTTDPQTKFAHSLDTHASHAPGHGGTDTVHGSLGDLLSPTAHHATAAAPSGMYASSSSSTMPGIPLLNAPPPAPVHAHAASPTPASPPAITSLDSPPDASAGAQYPLAIPAVDASLRDPAGAAGSDVESPSSFVDAVQNASPAGPPVGSLPRPPVGLGDGLPMPPIGMGVGMGEMPLPPPPPPMMMMMEGMDDGIPLPPPPPPPPMMFEGGGEEIDGGMPLPPPAAAAAGGLLRLGER